MANEISRRSMLKRSLVVVGAAVVSGSALAACGGEEAAGLDCSGTQGLTPPQVATRTSLGYVEATAQADKRCDNCSLYTAGAADACGTCTVVQGTINPAGYCNSWVAA